jgi:hypothetical protein
METSAKQIKSRTRIPQINSLTSLDVFPIQGTSVKVIVEVYRKAFTFKSVEKRETKFIAKVINAGDSAVTNIAIDFIAPSGLIIVDPGMQLGTSHRHVRLPRLNPQEKVKYKLGLKPAANFQSGILKIEFTESTFASGGLLCEARIGLTTS